MKLSRKTCTACQAKRSQLIRLCLAFIVVLAFIHANKLSAQTAKTPPQTKLQRHYRLSETIAYKMQGINQSPGRTLRYEAYVTGKVTKLKTSPNFIEDLHWSSLKVNGQPFPLSPASQQFREPLSLAPTYKLSIPDLSKVQPILIGPITDLLTFYADVQLAMRQTNLTRPGDHVYVKHGLPNSWADGTYTLIGQDSIDFDLTLLSIDPTTHIATVVVRHVPPAQPQIKLSAPWMRDPVGDTRNNWVQVQRASDGKYAAAIGQESFEANIQLDLPTGRILSATLDNPVEVLERSCDDATLTVCAAAKRYRIRRQITLTAQSGE
jgi:hypothetical protein